MRKFSMGLYTVSCILLGVSLGIQMTKIVEEVSK